MPPQAPLMTTDDKWVDHARRHFSKFCVLVVEAKLTQAQLQSTLADIALCKTHGGSTGNFVITFDANLFGESITAPHIRLPPLQQPIISKIWHAIQGIRKQPDQHGIMAIGDVAIIIDAGRKSDAFLKNFGMGKDRKIADKQRKLSEGKTLVRPVILSLDEKSVKARKHRKKVKNDYLQCSQIAYIIHNALTTISPRPHKHFPNCTNMSNILGAVTLTSWSSIPQLTIKDHKVSNIRGHTPCMLNLS